MTEYIKNAAVFLLVNDTDATNVPALWFSFGDDGGDAKKYDGLPVRCIKD
jgi:hypothetical protein